MPIESHPGQVIATPADAAAEQSISIGQPPTVGAALPNPPAYTEALRDEAINENAVRDYGEDAANKVVSAHGTTMSFPLALVACEGVAKAIKAGVEALPDDFSKDAKQKFVLKMVDKMADQSQNVEIPKAGRLAAENFPGPSSDRPSPNPDPQTTSAPTT